MRHLQNPAHVSPSRRELLMAAAAGVAAPALRATAQESKPASRPSGSSVKAFCIDFNWTARGVSPPGTFAQADPKEHVRWYQELGANVIQTFCVTYNGYAWYPSKVAPVTPNLRHPDFLGKMVELGHHAGMKVMGYFTLGANPWWEARHPDLVHTTDADFIKIPQTLEYLDYFCRQVEDALRHCPMDGFMIDWVRPTRHTRWLDCEREMYRQLMGEAFPTAVPSGEATLEFDRRAMERAWRHIRWTVRATRPAILWTNHPILKNEYPVWQGHRLLKEVDWILNESPEIEHLDWLSREVGDRSFVVQNLCGWDKTDASAWTKIDTGRFGLYGFARADEATTLPDLSMPANARNIGILRQVYHQL